MGWQLRSAEPGADHLFWYFPSASGPNENKVHGSALQVTTRDARICENLTNSRHVDALVQVQNIPSRGGVGCLA